MAVNQKKILEIIRTVAKEYNYTEEQIYQVYLSPWKKYKQIDKNLEHEILDISNIGKLVPNRKFKEIVENHLLKYKSQENK